MSMYGQEIRHELFRLSTRLTLSCVMFLCSLPTSASIVVTVDTSTFAGSNAQLAFDFIDGGTPSNSLVIKTFLTDGMLGANSLLGGVQGSLREILTLTDGAFFNEYLTAISLGSFLKFTINASSQANAGGGSIPDRFSFFLLSLDSGISLLSTNDPTGANSIFTLGIDGSVNGDLNIYSPIAQVSPPLLVPEPATATLLVVSLLVLALFIGSGTKRVGLAD